MFFSSNLHQDFCRNHFPKSWPSSSPSPLATQCDASWVSCPRIASAKRRCAPPAETTFHPKASSFWLAEQLEQNDDTSTTSHLIPAFREISRWFTSKSVEKWRHLNLMEILIDLTIYWIFIKALFLKMICLCLVLKRPSPGSHQPAFFLIWDASTLFVGILNLLVATNLRHCAKCSRDSSVSSVWRHSW